MSMLVVGLMLFLGMHSARFLFPDVKDALTTRLGLWGWKGLFSLVSIAGLVLIVMGYGQARMAPIWLWFPPVWLNHLTALLVLIAFIFLTATYVPGNRFKAMVGHPMLIGTKTWALAHLLSNPTLADLLLFGGFLVWAMVLYRVCRKADKAAGVTYPKQGVGRDLLTLGIAVAAYGIFAFWLHAWLIGVSPIPHG